MLTKLTKLAAVCAMLVPLAAAQQSNIYQQGGNWVQEVSGNLAGAKNIRVKADFGSIRIAGGAEDSVHYSVRNRSYTSSQETAKRQFDDYKVSAYVRGDTAWIVAEWNGGNPHFNSDFEVTVPRSAVFVKAESNAGNIDISGVAGRAEANSGGGGVRLQNIGQDVNVETGGGNVDLNAIGGDAHIETGGGNVQLGSIKGTVNASTGGGNMQLVSSDKDAVIETGGGSIHVEDCGGTLKVTTGGGDIDLGTVNAGAQVETGGGSIHLAGAKGFVQVESGSGHIELDGVPSANVETGAGAIVAKFISSADQQHNSKLETSAGDVIVYLAPSMHITVDAAIEIANGHTIQSDFPELHISNEGGVWGAKRAEGTLNGGGPMLKIRTTSGDIVIHRGM
jgi:hypothetical protein